MNASHLHLWGERIRIVRTEVLHIAEQAFDLHVVQASDDTHALLMVLRHRFEEDVVDVMAFLEHALARIGLTPQIRQDGGPAFLSALSPVHEALSERFGEASHGIIVLLNGEEPGGGTQALHEMTAQAGDELLVLYRVTRPA